MPDRLFSVDGQVVLVSGGSLGIGRALDAGFARRGAQVVITGRDRETLDTTAAQIASADLSVEPLVCDVAQVDAIRDTVSQVIERFERIDTLVNVAGVNRRQSAESYTPDDYDFILDINLKGAFFLSQEAGKHMIERGRGAQINIESLNSWAPLKGVLPYAMSKAGMQIMTRGLALEWGPHGVRVNSLAPGFVLTELTRQLWSDPTMQAWGKRNTPLGRIGEVDDMIGTTIFLASEAAAFLTGQTIYVDGGFTAGLNWPISLD